MIKTLTEIGKQFPNFGKEKQMNAIDKYLGNKTKMKTSVWINRRMRIQKDENGQPLARLLLIRSAGPDYPTITIPIAANSNDVSLKICEVCLESQASADEVTLDQPIFPVLKKIRNKLIKMNSQGA